MNMLSSTAKLPSRMGESPVGNRIEKPMIGGAADLFTERNDTKMTVTYHKQVHDPYRYCTEVKVDGKSIGFYLNPDAKAMCVMVMGMVRWLEHRLQKMVPSETTERMIRTLFAEAAEKEVS